VTRLFHTGFETGHLGVFSSTVGAWDANFAITTAQKRTGNYSLYIGTGGKRAVIAVPGNPTSLYVRLGFRYVSGNAIILYFLDSSGTRQVGLHIDGGSGVLQAKAVNTMLASGSAVPPNEWICYEIYVLIDNTNGRFVVKRNGSTDIDFTGDTRQGLADIGSVTLGYDSSFAGYYDDIAINDTNGAANNSWIGQGGVIGLKPSGAGTYSEWTPSAGDNYAAVDEIPPSEADYVQASVADKRDLYAMENMPAGTWRVDAVTWWARGVLDAAGDSYIARLMRQDGVDFVGADQGLDVTYKYVREVMANAPDGTAWTAAKVNAIEAGVKAT